MNRIDREKEVITLMINLYCEKKHKTKKGQLCPECEERRRRSIGVRSVLLKNKKRYGGC